jgi:hypothetical protein
MNNKFYIIFALTGLMASSGLAQSLALLGSSDVSENVSISVIVPKIARVELCESNNVIEVSSADIARGYVTLPKALSLKIWCNSSGGAVVETELNGSIRSQDGQAFPGEMLMFQLSGQKNFQPFNGQAQTLYQSAGIQRGTLLAVDLRLRISTEMPPGKYYFQAMFTVSSI